MTSHFLAINHESYDSSTVFGVFGSFVEARDFMEAESASPDAWGSPWSAVIEEWDGSNKIREYERWGRGRDWREYPRFDTRVAVEGV